MEDNEVESLKARVQLIIDEESLMSQSDLDNPQLFPRSIQVLQSYRKPEPPWAGLGGKMATEVKNVDQKVDRIDKAVKSVDTKMDKVQEKVCGLFLSDPSRM
jgi:hypothetical protein|eukprot:COSAG01_NODE_1608_length_9744_cov_3.534266_6_plen_102_part_00